MCMALVAGSVACNLRPGEDAPHDMDIILAVKQWVGPAIPVQIEPLRS